jgi:methylmalonyl-CoA mutase
MTVDPTSLAPFEPTTAERWRQAVDAVLAKGSELTAEQLAQRFERQLVSRTYDGLDIQPLYTADHAPAGVDSIPGQPPFTRGSTAASGIPNGWEVRQRVEITGDGSAAAALALSELERGTTGLWLDVAQIADHIDADLLDRALTGIFLELVPVTLDTGGRRAPGEALLQVWQRRGHNAHEARGVLGVDPLAALMTQGGTAQDVRAEIAEVVSLATRVASTYPQVRTLVADATPWHDAGSSDADELAGAIAAGVTYLRWMVDGGMDVATALHQIELRVAATADQFLTIAKIRALRALWHRVAEASGAEPAHRGARIHAVTSWAMTTRYDPWVNLLRDTVACFAAGVGGADAVTVHPYDRLVGPSTGTELGRRMARNTQAVLLDESNLGRVIDPAGGSWYVEHLTQALADTAWTAFQEIEAAGGLLTAYEQGWVHRRVDATWEHRQADIATRRTAITGVSEFPNIDDDISAPAPLTPSDHQGLVPLPRRRYADGFEVLRDAAAAHRRRTGTGPEVVLVGLGTAADSTARATFAKNLFEAGGLATRFVESTHETDLSGRLVCLCSSDARYGELAVDAAKAAKAAGATRVYLAGRPSDLVEVLRQAGVDEFVALGVDALDVLSQALIHAGVDR